MRKTRGIVVCLTLAVTVLFTGCTFTKSESAEVVKNDGYEIKLKAESKPLSKEELENKTNEIQSKLDSFMNSYAITDKSYSFSVLVAKDNQLLFKSAYGMADYDKKIPNTPQTAYQIGGITSQFTNTAILMLNEKRLLKTDDTIDKYIADYPNGNKIKITNLLSNTSGIPDLQQYVAVNTIEAGKHTYSNKELIENFKNKPLNFEPGTNLNYSSSNSILLGYIIEKVSGMSYENYIKSNILAPLKMEHSGMLTDKNKPQEIATGYSYIYNESVTKSFELESSLTYASAEIYSTVEDLFIWNSNLSSRRLIDESSSKEMFTPIMKNYGYGWFINKIDEDEKAFYSSSMPGYTSYIARNNDKGYVVIILGNKNNDKYSSSIGDYLLKAVSNE